MRSVLALVRANCLSAASYRMSLVLSLATTVAMLVPVYFIATAVQPVAAASIRNEGAEYFAFVLIGLITFRFMNTVLDMLPKAIAGGIGSGMLEVLLSTPTPLPLVLLGLGGYSLLWTSVQAVATLIVGILFGISIVWSHFLLGVGIIALIMLAYLPFGILSAASVIAFRTATPLNRGVLLLSTLLGGVYYSTTSIPAWLRGISEYIPLTHGLRALRRVVLEGESLTAVALDLAILTAFATVATAFGLLAFRRALIHARKNGTLSHY